MPDNDLDDMLSGIQAQVNAEPVRTIAKLDEDAPIAAAPSERAMRRKSGAGHPVQERQDYQPELYARIPLGAEKVRVRPSNLDGGRDRNSSAGIHGEELTAVMGRGALA